jgi:hypothetical protein
MWKWDKNKTNFTPKNKVFKDITGERFGRLVAQYPFRDGKAIRWNCLCDCGNQNNVLTSDLRTGQSTSCGCLKKEQTIEQNISRAKYIGGIPWRTVSYIKQQARIRNIEYIVDDMFLWELFLKQEMKCALSGLDIKFGKPWKQIETTASLDRIDSSKGYMKSNIQWVHKDVNYMKSDFDEEYFITVCKLISTKKGE